VFSSPANMEDRRVRSGSVTVSNSGRADLY
jgi:hypothetical protein